MPATHTLTAKYTVTYQVTEEVDLSKVPDDAAQPMRWTDIQKTALDSIIDRHKDDTGLDSIRLVGVWDIEERKLTT